MSSPGLRAVPLFDASHWFPRAFRGYAERKRRKRENDSAALIQRYGGIALSLSLPCTGSSPGLLVAWAACLRPRHSSFLHGCVTVVSFSVLRVFAEKCSGETWQLLCSWWGLTRSCVVEQTWRENQDAVRPGRLAWSMARKEKEARPPGKWPW